MQNTLIYHSKLAPIKLCRVLQKNILKQDISIAAIAPGIIKIQLVSLFFIAYSELRISKGLNSGHR